MHAGRAGGSSEAEMHAGRAGDSIFQMKGSSQLSPEFSDTLGFLQSQPQLPLHNALFVWEIPGEGQAPP